MTGNEDSNFIQKSFIIFLHHFNGHDYNTYWQEYGVNFMILCLGVLD
jgi:hypothetical protein